MTAAALTSARLHMAATLFHYSGVLALIAVAFWTHRDLWHRNKRGDEGSVKLVHRKEVVGTIVAATLIGVAAVLSIAADSLDVRDAEDTAS